MNDFTASNGVRIRPTNGQIKWAAPGSEVFGDLYDYASGSLLDIALAEMYRGREDERLGRWRWPENPEYVVYPRGNGSVTVFEESSPTAALTFWKGVSRPGTSSGKYMDAARAYFDAHPEPKPWHDAKPGEVWLLEMDGSPVLVEAGTTGAKLVFWPITGKPGSTSQHKPVEFTAGRRIWPEAVAS